MASASIPTKSVASVTGTILFDKNFTNSLSSLVASINSLHFCFFVLFSRVSYLLMPSQYLSASITLFNFSAFNASAMSKFLNTSSSIINLPSKRGSLSSVNVIYALSSVLII